MQTILYSNKKLGKERKHKVRWVMEFPYEWLAYDKFPKDLRDSLGQGIGKEKSYKRN